MNIYFDCDGTWINLYGVNNWLSDIINENPRPYYEAQPMLNLAVFARRLNFLQKKGYKIGIITWLAKNSTPTYDKLVKTAKLAWLQRHLPSVKWDEIHIIPYGTPKNLFINNKNDILFDDEENNRLHWTGIAYDEKHILEILKQL